MVHWCDKRAAKARIGDELRGLGWRLFGWKEDRSDSMTDYYDPASWNGVASKGDAVVCVDVGAWDAKKSGEIPAEYTYEPRGTCGRCEGTGIDPTCGWTLGEAREDPTGFHVAEQNAQREIGRAVTSSIFPGAISPIPFEKHGRRTCEKCNGGGADHVERILVEDEAKRWPVFQANPPRCSWHVERGGRIVAKGVGVFSVESDWRRPDDETPRPKLSRLLARIEGAATGRSDAPGPARPAEPVDEVTVRPGTREGFSEVVFPEKPAAIVRAALKAAGFRWSRAGGCWYGKSERIPECVAGSVPA